MNNPVEDDMAKSGIHIDPEHKGLLRAQLDIPEGEQIPLSALMQAKKSKSAKTRRRATFALASKSWKHDK